jgi:hypothetical protein
VGSGLSIDFLLASLEKTTEFPERVYFISASYPLANRAFLGQKTIGQAGFS